MVHQVRQLTNLVHCFFAETEGSDHICGKNKYFKSHKLMREPNHPFPRRHVWLVPLLMMLFCLWNATGVRAQKQAYEREVHGIVTDENGDPLPAAQIL